MDSDLEKLKQAQKKISEILELLNDVDGIDDEYDQLMNVSYEFRELIDELEMDFEEDPNIPNLERDLIIADMKYEEELDKRWGLI